MSWGMDVVDDLDLVNIGRRRKLLLIGDLVGDDSLLNLLKRLSSLPLSSGSSLMLSIEWADIRFRKKLLMDLLGEVKSVLGLSLLTKLEVVGVKICSSELETTTRFRREFIDVGIESDSVTFCTVATSTESETSGRSRDG